jgi:hypothetical protein
MQLAYVPSIEQSSKKYLQPSAPDSCACQSAAMPVTPRFQLAQTDEYVLVTIRVPHIRVSAAETHVEVSLRTDALVLVLCVALGCAVSLKLVQLA